MVVPESHPPWLVEVMAEVMAAIASCQSTLTEKIEDVQLDVGLLRQDMDKLRSRVMEMEQRVGPTEDDVMKQSAAIRTLQSKAKALKYRA